MAPQLSEQEQLAQVRRMQRLRPQTSAAVVAEGASRTPNIMRYIRANERRLEGAGGDTSSVATTPNTSAIKKHFVTSRLIDDKNEVLTNNASNVLLPHTPFTSGREIKRFPQVKGRRNIYELPEDNSSVFTTAPVLQATPKRPAPATALQPEPLTSSFQCPDTPSCVPREESQTFEECLNVARKASQMCHKESTKPQSQYPVGDGFGSQKNETVTIRTQEIPPNPRQEEQLAKLDMEILHLGEDNQDFASAATPSNLEHARMAIQKGHQDDFRQFVDDADSESDAHSERPPKKRSRSSRQIPNVVSRNVALQELNSRRRSKAVGRPTGKKSKVSNVYGKSQKSQKQKRRLPVNELITVNERPGNSDVEITGSIQVELSQDPISQQADESDSDENEGEYYKPGLRLKININSRKRFGAIDIALFRIPKHQDPAPARSGHKKSSYSDGFEGKEAAPIGLYMPVKHPIRRRESYKKLTIKLGKLTLVPERPSEERQAEPQHRPSRKQRLRRVVKSVPDAHIESGTAPGHREYREPSYERPVLDESLLDNVLAEDDEDQMLIDGPDKEIAADVGVPKSGLKEQNTPSVASISATSETPEHLISPLKRKQSGVDEDMTAVGNLQGSQRPASQTPQGHLSRKEDESRISQHRAATSIIKKTPIRARTESLKVVNELMMVSVQRRPRDSKYDTDSSEEDGDSERESAESYFEPDDEDKDGSDEAPEEYGGDLTPEEDSEQDEDHDAEEESHPQWLVAEVVADSAGSGNPLQNSLRDGIQVAPERAEMPINSEVGRDVGTRDKFPLVNQESQITRAAPSDARLKQMVLQALQEVETVELERQSQIEQASHGNCGQEAKGQDITIPKHYWPEEIQLEQNDDPDPSWRPRMPNTRGPAMEVDEDIVDSPTPTASQGRFSVHRHSSRRRSGIGGQQLTMVRTQPQIPIPEEDPADERGTQGSIELGQQQGNGRHSPSYASPERQPSKHLEIPETQFSVEPQMSYIERALSQLNEPNSVPRSRIKSMPARAFFAQAEYVDDGMMAGGITMSAAFHHTVSPPKSGSREECPAQEKILKALARQASLSMGAMPGSARKRTPSLPLKPPFLRSTM